MTLGLYDQERRRRQRFWLQMAKAVVVLALLLVVGLFAYQMGVERQKALAVAAAEDTQSLRREKEELERSLAQAQQATRAAEAHAAELDARVRRAQPQGEFARLHALIAEKLSAGVDPNRIAFAMSEMQPARKCDPAETRRLVMTLPQHRGTPPSVTVGAVTVGATLTATGEGVPAKGPRGQAENWFDPAQPVRIRLVDPAGKRTALEGMLPLSRSLLVAGSEFRVTVSAGPRSFVEIRAERCPFP
jgi:hypothetical protein